VGCGCVKVSSAARCRVENMFDTVVDLFEAREYLKMAVLLRKLMNDYII